MTTPVDPFRFVDPYSTRLAKVWSAAERPGPIPFSRPGKPLSQCTVALISSAGLALKTDTPFDQDGERANPFWGDPTHRVIPADATANDVTSWHLHIDTRPLAEELDTVLPLARLNELVAAGEVGASARSHYSFMGYQPDATALVRDTAPKIIATLRAEQVDAVLLVPV